MLLNWDGKHRGDDMSRLEIYGAPATRTHRVVWMANELGLDYRVVPTHYKDGSNKTPEFLAINPNGRVPAIRDGEFCLFESLAINLYLARKHGGETAPKDLEEEGLAYQWSLWAANEVEAHALTALQHGSMLPEAERDAEKAAAATEALGRPFAVLEQSLSGRPYLLGDRFTVADLNVAAVASWAKLAKMDLSGWPNLADWLRRCLARPACKAASKI